VLAKSTQAVTSHSVTTTYQTAIAEYDNEYGKAYRLVVILEAGPEWYPENAVPPTRPFVAASIGGAGIVTGVCQGL